MVKIQVPQIPSCTLAEERESLCRPTLPWQCPREGAHNVLQIRVLMASFEQWHPHLILLDIHLPDFDGYGVARRMRGQWVDHMPGHKRSYQYQKTRRGTLAR